MRINIENEIKPSKVNITIFIVIFLLLSSIGIVSGDEDPDDDTVNDADEDPDDDTDDDSSKPTKDKAKNAGAAGKPTFLIVDEYKHWVVKVNKAKDKNGIDLVTIEYDAETRTLSITAKDGNPTNNVNILVNKDFVEDLITDDPDNLQFDLSDAVNYDGMNTSNASNGNGAVYVFHITHFSTQVIKISTLVFLGTTGYIAIGIGGLLVVIAAVFLFRSEKKRW